MVSILCSSIECIMVQACRDPNHVDAGESPGQNETKESLYPLQKPPKGGFCYFSVMVTEINDR